MEPPQRPGAAADEPRGRFAQRESARDDQRRSDDDFRRAGRHSRRVRLLRRALPLGVLTALGLTLAVNYLDPFTLGVDLPFDLGRVTLSGTRVMMEFPKLHGFTQDNRGYSVTAQSASQDLTQPNQIDLTTIDAKLELADQGWANLVANTGKYDTKTEQMTLGGGINFSTSAGYGGELETVVIDVKGGTLVSDRPVQLSYLDGKLTADRMEVSQKTARALLTGNVRLNFRMPSNDEKGENGGASGPAAPGSAPRDSSADQGMLAPELRPISSPLLRGSTAGLP
ncbi:LPS export ABC transporter periplasmic protein LptC [Ancylobacter radicis]|uniref:LPS export ABC transporter periplasmic protein LptC n=1 Tax=Ancylobacter radicis TaxID=2836179 RepID=UPI0035106E51